MRREVKAGARIIDGLGYGPSGTTLIEIKLLTKASDPVRRIRQALLQMQQGVQHLDILGVPPLRFLLFLVLADDDTDAASIGKSAEREVTATSKRIGIPIDVRVERFSDLERRHNK